MGTVIEREKLLNALQGVKPGLAQGRKDIDDQFLSFVFTDERVLSYNDEVFVSHPLKIPLEGAVRAEVLLPLLNKLTAEEVELSQEQGKIILKCGRTTSGIQLDQEITIPLESIQPPKDFHPMPEGFLETLKFCSFSAAKDMRKRALTCLHLTDKFVESCDNYRVTRWKTEGLGKEEILLPARHVKALEGFELTKWGLGDGWLFFKGKGRVIIACRLDSEEYPNLGDILKVKGEEVIFPKSMVESLDRAGIFTDEASSQIYVEVAVSEKEFMVRGEGPHGWFEERIPTRKGVKGKEVRFKIEPQLLGEILSHHRGATVGPKTIKFSGDSFEHIIILRTGE